LGTTTVLHHPSLKAATASGGREAAAQPAEAWLVPSSPAWVLIYGYSTRAQYDQLLQLAAEWGQILDTRGSCVPGRSNWLAVQYETELQAEKAACHQHFELQCPEGGGRIFCGVKRLPDSDPLLLQSSALMDEGGSLWEPRRRQQPALIEQEKPAVPAPPRQQLMPPPTHDIYLHSARRRVDLGDRPHRGICERLLRWFLSLED
jgi:hypothetical protein